MLPENCSLTGKQICVWRAHRNSINERLSHFRRLILNSYIDITFTAIVPSVKDGGTENKMSGKTIAILGDSYSTYKGYIPEDYAWWYSDEGNELENDVHGVEETWWFPLFKKYKFERIVNSSFSGSTVCYTGYDGQDYSKISFIRRMKREFPASEKTDLMIVFGGTNDFWAGSPVGEAIYGGWSEKDFTAFSPAFSYMLHWLRQEHPDTTILNLTNGDITGAVRENIEKICAHYKVENLVLTDVEKENGHPNRLGMRQIREQVEQWKAFRDAVR